MIIVYYGWNEAYIWNQNKKLNSIRFIYCYDNHYNFNKAADVFERFRNTQ